MFRTMAILLFLAARSFSGSARYLARREVRSFHDLLDTLCVERSVSFQALLDSFHVERPVSFQALLCSSTQAESIIRCLEF